MPKRAPKSKRKRVAKRLKRRSRKTSRKVVLRKKTRSSIYGKPQYAPMRSMGLIAPNQLRIKLPWTGEFTLVGPTTLSMYSTIILRMNAFDINAAVADVNAMVPSGSNKWAEIYGSARVVNVHLKLSFKIAHKPNLVQDVVPMGYLGYWVGPSGLENQYPDRTELIQATHDGKLSVAKKVNWAKLVVPAPPGAGGAPSTDYVSKTISCSFNMTKLAKTFNWSTIAGTFGGPVQRFVHDPALMTFPTTGVLSPQFPLYMRVFAAGMVPPDGGIAPNTLPTIHCTVNMEQEVVYSQVKRLGSRRITAAEQTVYVPDVTVGAALPVQQPSDPLFNPAQFEDLGGANVDDIQ